MGNLDGHRDANGRFAVGNPGGPGRPRRAVEQDYLATLADAVPLKKWKRIVSRAVADAAAGDAKARRWISEHLVGRRPDALTALAATELAGTLDDEIRVQAAGLRTSVLRRKILNRTSEYPDLCPGRPAGLGHVEGRVPDLHIDPGPRQPDR
jgi:hypothetical protein